MLDTALLLGFGLAILPAFKMKYWNMGANGQILMSCLAAIYCMIEFTGKNAGTAYYFAHVCGKCLNGDTLGRNSRDF